MKREQFFIGHIPAILWGEASEKWMLAIHGNQSSKADVPIAILAEEGEKKGYQVLSFDLPKHGDRMEEETLCKVQVCVEECKEILKFAAEKASELSLFGCSIGAYFGLCAYGTIRFQQVLFLSPVVDMARIIQNMMGWFQISEERLEREGEIPTPIGQILYWDYYRYVQKHPVIHWVSPTTILCGEKDELCEKDRVDGFAKRFHAQLDIVKNAGHFFHTEEEMSYYRGWLKRKL